MPPTLGGGRGKWIRLGNDLVVCCPPAWYQRTIRRGSGANILASMPNRNTNSDEPGTARARSPLNHWPQARVAPPWRDRGTWVQFVVQSVFFFGIAAMSINVVTMRPLTTTVAEYLGYAIAFVALLIQRYVTERGIALVAIGLALVLIAMFVASPDSGVPPPVLAYGIVAYEAWYISAYSRRFRRWLALLVIGSIAAAVYYVLAYPNEADFRQNAAQSATAVVLSLVTIGLGWQLGLGTRRRVEEVTELAAKAELAALAERTRIAREMHDIVAHSLTVVIAQSDGGRYAARKDPHKAVEALETIGSTGREALVQMRGLLSVLREGEARSLDSTPGLSGLPALVAGSERDGLRVDFEQVGEARSVREATGLAVYRIVQESLTNVLKHAGRTEALVELAWQGETLGVTVENAPGRGLVDSDASNEPGRGLAGIAERAKVLGGAASWGESTRFPGGFAVEVEVPA